MKQEVGSFSYCRFAHWTLILLHLPSLKELRIKMI